MCWLGSKSFPAMSLKKGFAQPVASRVTRHAAMQGVLSTFPH